VIEIFQRRAQAAPKTSTPIKRGAGFGGLSPLQWTMHLGAWIPLAILLVDAISGNLTINPIQDATQQMGRAAILLLSASLSITPLKILTGVRELQKLARPLGLYAFFYVVIHLTLYAGVDYGFDLSLLVPDAADKKYIFIGLAAFLILLALAVTSSRWSMKRLGKHWKQLHRLVYAAGVLAVLHYALAAKGDLFRLQGNILGPAIYLILVALLLIVRIPRVRKWIIVIRDQLRRLLLKNRNAV
jgi:methionine sulfoxide reductase heme-binding subunit